LLQVWRASAAAEEAIKGQKTSAVVTLAGLLGSKLRERVSTALQTWSCRAVVARQQIAAGVVRLDAWLQARQRTDLASAFQGVWRSVRWQALLRTVDAAAVREKRQLQHQLQALEKRAEEGDSARRTLDDLKARCLTAERGEADARSLLRKAEARLSGGAEEEILTLKDRGRKWEEECTELSRQLALAKSELAEQREIADIEAAAKASALEREQELLIGLQTLERQQEHQAKLIRDRDITIEKLDQDLRDRHADLRRQRRENCEKAKVALLQDQVAALKDSLSKEQAELRASERAWAGDRAALLALGGGPATRRRPSGSAEGAIPLSVSLDRKPGGLHRSSSASEPLARSPSPNAARVLCPWHGQRGVTR